MKKSLIILAILAIAGNTFSQKFKVIEGKSFKDKSLIIDFIDIGRGEYLSYNVRPALIISGAQFREPTNYLLKFDKSMNKINSVEIEPVVEGKLLTIERIFNIGSDIYALMSFYNSSKKKKYLFVGEVDRTDLKITGNIVKIGEFKKASKDEIPGDYIFANSENNKFAGIFMTDPVKKVKYKRKLFSKSPPTVQKNPSYVNFIVIDRDLKVINSGKKVAISGTSDIKSELTQTIIDNSGNVLLLGSDSKYASGLRDGLFGKKIEYIEKTRFTVHKLATDGGSYFYNTDETELEGKQWIIDVQLIMDNKNNRIHLVALKGDEINKTSGSSGVIKIELDNADLSDLSTEFADFNENVMEKVNRSYQTTTKEAKDSKKNKNVPTSSKRKSKTDQKMEKSLTNQGLTSLNRFAGITVDDLGNVFVALEHHWITIVEHRSTNSNGVTTVTYTYYYHYGNMAFIKFDVENDEILQNAYNKYNVLINISAEKPTTFAKEDGRFIVLAQKDMIEINDDLEKINSKEFMSIKKMRKGGMVNQFFIQDKMINTVKKGGKTSYTLYEFL
jgi:hypothetical protein